MNLSNLPSISERKHKRLGQGHGSGRMKTSGRGTKGQNSRSKRALSFEGGALPLIKRLPFRRGRGLNSKISLKPVIINVSALNSLQKNTIIDIKLLVQHHVVSEKEAIKRGVKILGEGELTIPLTVKLPVSQNAKEKIEKAGGSVVE